MRLLFVWPLLSVAAPHRMEATPQARNEKYSKDLKKKRMPPLQVPQIEMHCRMSTSQMTVKSHSNSPLLLSATLAVCNQGISSFNLGFDRNACTWVLPGTTAPCWIVSIHSTLTWACHSAFASAGCPVSCFLYMGAEALWWNIPCFFSWLITTIKPSWQGRWKAQRHGRNLP